MKNDVKLHKVVVCPDSFKGSLSATQVACVIAETIRKEIPQTEIIQLPLADGGEGTGDIISGSSYPISKSISVCNPLGRKITTNYYTDKNLAKAFIESAKIIGLPLLKPEERNPLLTSSYGLGEAIKDAILSGCTEITVSLGGSATCDGGKGMLDALEDIDSHITFRVLCDVENPLLGENGAVSIFAPQKGARPEDLPLLEKRLKSLSDNLIAKGVCNKKACLHPGAGAAGGLGFAFQTVLNAESIKGIDFVLESLKFNELIKEADLIITGEGKIDKQSLMGKVLSGVLKRSIPNNIPVIAVGGIINDEQLLINAGVSKIYSISDPSLSEEENMSASIALSNLRRTIKYILKELK